MASNQHTSGVLPSPIPFLQPDAQGNFHVNEEAARILEKAQGKLVVVAVTGPYRTGKSYLLNRIISATGTNSQQSGFAVGNTINACTKGIWLWSVPEYDPKTNTSYVYLDTEGLNSTGEEVTFDTQIFSLSVLLSSVFILNTSGTLNENSLEQLELVTECSKNISFQATGPKQLSNASKSETGSQKAIDSELVKHFPSLFWVLRDFSLALEDKDGNSITPDEYLESVLRPIPSTRKGAEEKNAIRHSIKSFFTRRHCIPLVRPVSDENLLQKLDSLPPSQLRPAFEEKLGHLIRSIREGGSNGAFVKRIDQRPVTGPALVGLARTYAHAINSGAIPSIMSAWQSVIEIASKNLAADAYDNFVATLHKEVTSSLNALSDGAVSRVVSKALNDAKTFVENGLPGSEDVVKRIWDWLRDRLDIEAEKVRVANSKRSEEACRRVFFEMWEDDNPSALFSEYRLRSLLTPPTVRDENGVEMPGLLPLESTQNVLGFLSSFKKEYRSHAIGSAAPAVEARLMERIVNVIVSTWGPALAAALKQQIGLQKKVTELHSQKEKLEASYKIQFQKLSEQLQESKLVQSRFEMEIEKRDSKIQHFQEVGEKYIADLSALEVDKKNANKKVEEIREDLRTAIYQADLGKRDVEKLTDALQTLKQKHEQYKSQILEIEKNNVEKDATISQLKSSLQKTRQDLQDEIQRAGSLEKSVLQKTEHFQSDRDQILRQSKEKIGQLSDIVDEQKLQLNASQVAQAESNTYISKIEQELSQAKNILIQQQNDLKEADLDHSTLQSKLEETQNENKRLEHSIIALREELTQRRSISLQDPRKIFTQDDLDLARDQAKQEVFQEMNKRHDNSPSRKRSRLSLIDEEPSLTSKPARQMRFAEDVHKHDGRVGPSATYENSFYDDLDDSFRTVADTSLHSSSIAYMDQATRQLRERKSLGTSLPRSEKASAWELPGDKHPVIGASPSRIPRASQINEQIPRQSIQRRTSTVKTFGVVKDLGTEGKQYLDIRDLPLEAVDVQVPEELKIQELKYWLTSIDYVLPQNKTFKKQELVDLIKRLDPRLK